MLHATALINSLAHVWGSRRYETTDQSRNNALLAVITLGEGWHNNHHEQMNAARQGVRWWEIDMSYYSLWVLARLGIVWDIRGRKSSSRLKVASLLTPAVLAPAVLVPALLLPPPVMSAPQSPELLQASSSRSSPGS